MLSLILSLYNWWISFIFNLEIVLLSRSFEEILFEWALTAVKVIFQASLYSASSGETGKMSFVRVPLKLNFRFI